MMYVNMQSCQKLSSINNSGLFDVEKASKNDEMICRMCLIDCTEIIGIFDSDGSEMNIASIISKHFWFEPKPDDPISNMICNACWWKIDSFHVYYMNIEEAHRKLSETYSVKQITHCYSNPSNSIKKEEGIQIHVIVEGQSEVNKNTELLENELNKSDSPVSEYVDGMQVDKEDHDETENFIDIKKNMKTESQVDNGENTEINFERRKSKRRSKKRLKSMKLESGEDNYSSQDEAVVKERKNAKAGKQSDYLKKSKEDDEKIEKYMKLKCELCPAEFRIFAEVRRHYRTIHKQKGYVVCCNKKLYKRVLILDHINKHLNPDHFKCNTCNKIFSDNQCLKNHMIRHESEDAKIFKCEKCPRRYSKQYLLDQHKLIHIPQEEREFFCDECGKAFSTNNLMQTHRRYVHENAYGQMCHICAKVIRGKAMFEKHQLEHAGIVEPKVQCQKCGAWLKHEYSLKKHMRRHAEELSSHVCNICGKSSPTKGALRSHIRYVHASERSYQCSVCNKAFKKPLNLKEHMTTHTGEVLYTCPHCPKTFNSSANMHSHRKKVHRKEWEEGRRNRGLPLTDGKCINTDTEQLSLYDDTVKNENQTSICDNNVSTIENK